MESIKIYDKQFRPYISAQQIDQSVEKCAADINLKFEKASTVPIVVSVLNGSIFFTADLTRKFNFDFEIDTYKYCSYQGTQTTVDGNDLFGLKLSIEGKDVILIDDIVESGFTMEKVIKSLERNNPKSITIVVLVHKPNCQKAKINVDYAAITIPDNEFIVGYGFDYNELGRALKDIYILEE